MHTSAAINVRAADTNAARFLWRSVSSARKPDSGYARQNAVIGRKTRKITPARLGFRGAKREPTRKPTPNGPMPTKVNHRGTQPWSRSPRGAHHIPNFASAQSPTKKPIAARTQLNTTFSFSLGRIAYDKLPKNVSALRFLQLFYSRHRCVLTSSRAVHGSLFPR